MIIIILIIITTKIKMITIMIMMMIIIIIRRAKCERVVWISVWCIKVCASDFPVWSFPGKLGHPTLVSEAQPA